MTPRKFALALVASASILTACGDSKLLQASLPTVQDAYVVFALSGTPASFPSGINTYLRSPARVDGGANFDIAFDIDSAGNAVIYPVQRIVSSLSASRRVGLRRVAGTFADVTEAPTGLYADSAVVARPGEIVIVQATKNGTGDVCQFDIAPFVYTKVVVDSISLASRMIVAETVLNPNCGFRSFKSGIPEK